MSEVETATARLEELATNLRTLNAGWALAAVYGEFPRPEITLAGDLLAVLRFFPAPTNPGQPSEASTAAPATDAQSDLCEDCPPNGYPTDKTRCEPCPRRADQGLAREPSSDTCAVPVASDAAGPDSPGAE